VSSFVSNNEFCVAIHFGLWRALVCGARADAIGNALGSATQQSCACFLSLHFFWAADEQSVVCRTVVADTTL
jgi:hypothetical protein